MAELPDDVSWIGLDGGASGARACRVAGDGGQLTVLCAGEPQRYEPVPGFVPVLAGARTSGFSMREHHQARNWVRAAADAVMSAGVQGRLLLGVAMPGLKSEDARGLAWLRHGPRAPEFLTQLEAELEVRGVQWLMPAGGLYSDGLCAALGEQVGRQGALGCVREALYLGGGTGLAEAAVCAGRVQSVDEAPLELAKARELESGRGANLEECLSMSGLVARCAGFPELLMDSAAVRAELESAAVDLAELCARRAREWRERARPALERVVVGQRLGALLEDPRCADFAARLAVELEARGLPPEGWLVPGSAPQAGALGAAARARAAWDALDA